MPSTTSPTASSNRWLRGYYYLRFAFSAAWAALAITVAKENAALASILLIIYPAWDAVANYIDAQKSGGLANNKTQLLNFVVSIGAAFAVAAVLSKGVPAMLVVFGIWAVLAGVLQLATGVKRWKAYGAQWAMVLSGAQSALAGGFIISRAQVEADALAALIGYVLFGAAYFLVSALWLTFKRNGAAHAA